MSLHLCPLGGCKLSGVLKKFLSLIRTEGVPPTRVFEKILFTYSHRERQNAHPVSESFLKTPLTHLDKGARFGHPFFKTSSHLFPLGKAICTPCNKKFFHLYPPRWGKIQPPNTKKIKISPMSSQRERSKYAKIEQKN